MEKVIMNSHFLFGGVIGININCGGFQVYVILKFVVKLYDGYVHLTTLLVTWYYNNEFKIFFCHQHYFQ